MVKPNKTWRKRLYSFMIIILVLLVLTIALPIVGWTVYKIWENYEIERLFKQACEEYGGYEIYQKVRAEKKFYSIDPISGKKYFDTRSEPFRDMYTLTNEKIVISSAGPINIMKKSIVRNKDKKLLGYVSSVFMFKSDDLFGTSKSSLIDSCYGTFKLKNKDISNYDWLIKNIFDGDKL